MSQLTLLDPQVDPLVDAQEVRFWMEKAGAGAGAEDSPTSQKDTCLPLGQLRDFLQALLTHIQDMSSTAEAMRRLPFLGQLLGRFCWRPNVTADAVCRRLLLQSVWSLYSEEPASPVETKANQWIRNILCQLTTEGEDGVTQILVENAAVPPKEFHRRVLQELVSLLSEEVGRSCSSLSRPGHRCSCDALLAVSDTCLPLVTCPEASPLIGALLQRTVTCARASLSQDFLEAVSSAYLSKGLSLEKEAVVSLWRHSLPSLEGAVTSLLDCVLTSSTSPSPHAIEQHLEQSVLPRACALHPDFFLIVNDIFRFLLQQVEGHLSVLWVVQSFTYRFLREVARLQPEERPPMKSFFPNSPTQILQPMVVLPTEMPPEARTHHLTWIVQSLQRLTEEEEVERDGDTGTRGQCGVFEAWMLVVQCGHWVEAAVQLLAAPGPPRDGDQDPERDGDQDRRPLLWLLTFCHHPTHRGHHRALQLARARKALSHVRSLFLNPSPLVTSGTLLSLEELLSVPAEPRPLATGLVLRLLVNMAAFSEEPISRVCEVVQTVVQRCGLVTDALWVLSAVELGLQREGPYPGPTHPGHSRVSALRDALTSRQRPETP